MNSDSFIKQPTAETAFMSLRVWSGQWLKEDCFAGLLSMLGRHRAVAGYAPWTTLYTSAKALQLKRLFRWLSRDTLSGYMDSFHKISLWLRRDDNGRIAAVVLNASQDAAEELVVSIRTKNTRGTVTNMNCKETSLSASEQDGPYMKFQLPAIAPWHLALLTV